LTRLHLTDHDEPLIRFYPALTARRYKTNRASTEANNDGIVLSAFQFLFAFTKFDGAQAIQCANSRAKGSASQCQGRDRRTSRHDMSKRQALVAIVVGGPNQVG
jgi:hypothetical protein